MRSFLVMCICTLFVTSSIAARFSSDFDGDHESIVFAIGDFDADLESPSLDATGFELAIFEAEIPIHNIEAVSGNLAELNRLSPIGLNLHSHSYIRTGNLYNECIESPTAGNYTGYCPEPPLILNSIGEPTPIYTRYEHCWPPLETMIGIGNYTGYRTTSTIPLE